MEKDVEWKDFFHDNLRYADIINGIGCEGEQLIKDTDLQEVDPTEKKKTRDLLRRVAMGMNFAIVGIENQEKIDYKFPLRNMHYDVTRYHRQATDMWKSIHKNFKGLTSAEYLSRFKKDSKLYPQVTFVLYAGEEEWSGPTCLHDMLDFTDIPECLQKMVSDYKINVIDIRRFENTSIFKTDIRQVFDFIRCSEDEEKLGQLVESDTYYQNMADDAYEVVTRYTNSRELISKEQYVVEGGRYNVCKAIKDMVNRGRAEGRAEGSRDTLITTAKNFFANGASYDLVRASIKEFTDEELLSIYEEVCA